MASFCAPFDYVDMCQIELRKFKRRNKRYLGKKSQQQLNLNLISAAKKFFFGNRDIKKVICDGLKGVTGDLTNILKMLLTLSPLSVYFNVIEPSLLVGISAFISKFGISAFCEY